MGLGCGQHERLKRITPDVVVFGHTHMPCNERLDGVLYLNPGSPATPRGGAAASVAIVEFENGTLRARHITLT